VTAPSSERPTISALVHAPSKTGKSTLCSTAPLPICVFDVEGSWRFIKTQGYRNADRPIVKRYWDPLREPPPRYDGTWNVCVVKVRDWATLVRGYMHLVQSPHDFVSVIVDSITEAQRKLKSQLRGLEAMRIQDWGDLLNQMDKWIRDVRDLVLIPNLPTRMVIFVAETEMYEGKWRPAMQGQIKRGLPYWVDVCGYMYTELEGDVTGAMTVKVKKLLVMSDHPQFEAGERVQGVLGDVVRYPDFTQMYETIFEEPPPTPGTVALDSVPAKES
jgi:hypothetical protein